VPAGDGRNEHTPAKRPWLVLGLSAVVVGLLFALAWPLLGTAFVNGYVEYFFVQLLYQLGCY